MWAQPSTMMSYIRALLLLLLLETCTVILTHGCRRSGGRRRPPPRRPPPPPPAVKAEEETTLPPVLVVESAQGSGVCLPCGGSDKGNFEPTPVDHFGLEAKLGDAPWQVALTEKTGSNILDDNFCGGTLINADWVLTAAQCTKGRDPTKIYAYIGLIDLQSPGPRAQCERKIEHPDYSNVTGNFDFSLLKMEIGFNLPMIPFVSPSCLPSADNPENVDVLLSGWVTQEWSLDSGDNVNQPHMLQREIIRTESSADCAYMYGETCPTGGSCVCAHAIGEFDSCQGDIGGPLIHKNGDRPELYGVYSGGYDCGSPRFPGVYTNVFRVKEWIIQETGGECT